MYLIQLQSCQVCDQDTVIMFSENQFLMDFYQEIVAALLKGYMLLQMNYMIWTTNSTENYRETAERVRDNFIHNISIIQDDAKAETRNASRAMWACDPEDFFNTGTASAWRKCQHCLLLKLFVIFDRFVYRNIAFLSGIH